MAGSHDEGFTRWAIGCLRDDHTAAGPIRSLLAGGGCLLGGVAVSVPLALSCERAVNSRACVSRDALLVAFLV